MLCPVPIIRLARTASSLPPGSLVELLTDDPAAEYDVPAWCRLRGHELRALPSRWTAPHATAPAAAAGARSRSRTAPTRTPVRPCAT